MKIYDEYRTQYIEFNKIGLEDYYYPSLNIEIKIKTEILEAKIDGIWIARKDVNSFIVSLGSLEESRKGSSILVGMSPKRFKMELKGIDNAGHLGIGIRIEKENFSETGYNDLIQTAFKTDPGILPNIILELKSLITNH